MKKTLIKTKQLGILRSRFTGFRADRGGRLPAVAVHFLYKPKSNDLDVAELHRILKQIHVLPL